MEAVRSTSRLAAGTPRAFRAEHIAGSHATMAVRLTCCDTHAAALWTAAASPTGPWLAWPEERAASVLACRLPPCCKERASATPLAASRIRITAAALRTRFRLRLE